MATTVETKIKELLREAQVKDKWYNVSAIKFKLETLKRRRSYTKKHHPTSLFNLSEDYKLRFEEDGYPPELPPKYYRFIRDAEVQEKLMKKYNGRCRTTVCVENGDFSLTFTVLITYVPDVINDEMKFSNIHVETTAMSAGVPPDPIDKVAFEACCVYEDYSRASRYTVGECNIEADILRQLLPDPPSAKRARSE